MSDPASIDYRPLSAMRHAWWSVIKSKIGILLLLGLVLVGGLSVLIASGVPAVIAFIVYYAITAVRVADYKNRAWANFAQANGWPLDTQASVLELVPPSLQFGHSQKLSPVIRTQLGQAACDLFSYHTTTGGGKDQQTHYYTVGRAPLPRTLPHMLLLSKHVHFADLRPDLVDGQALQLEGDFDAYFKLQIEKGQQIDALSIITPDVMQTLVQYAQAEDIEIIGQNLYFILKSDKRDPAHTQALIQSTVELSRQIMQNVTLAHGPLENSSPSIVAPAPSSPVTADSNLV